jgi:N-acetylglucosaminyl-diphospho-decaprenol L-rhamnosyltransferase
VSQVAAVIGNYNGASLLEDCIVSLRAQEPAPTELVVIDGRSTDGSIAVAEGLGVPVVCRPNLGLGHLYNVGVAATTADYVFLANNDIALEPGCLGELASALDADPSVFAADARQLDWSGTRTIHARTTLSRGRMIREFLPGLRLDPNVRSEEVAQTVCANGAAMMVRRSQYDELGGFDETFFMEWEDLDLCWRAWLRNWSTLYVPGAVVRHRVGAVTTSEVRPRRSASSHHNLVRFALKCLPRGAAARVILGELLRLPAHPRSVGLGLVSVARELREISRERRSTVRVQDVFESLMAAQ